MALINCSECGREISQNAKQCPGCGARRPFNWKVARRVAYALVALIAVDGFVTITTMNRYEREVQECWNSISSADMGPERSTSEIECQRLLRNFVQRYGRSPTLVDRQ